jgi:hypothetical protein
VLASGGMAEVKHMLVNVSLCLFPLGLDVSDPLEWETELRITYIYPPLRTNDDGHVLLIFNVDLLTTDLLLSLRLSRVMRSSHLAISGFLLILLR